MKLLFENWRKYLITEAEGQTLYHIGKRPASPKPKRSGWYSEPGDEEGWDRPQHDEPIESGVFLTPNPVGIAQNHGIFGHVYAYNVSNALIAAAGGLNRYDFGSEVLIPEDLWNEGIETGEIQFLGKSMDYDKFVKKADRAMSMGDRLARSRRRLDESFSKPEDQAIEKASFNSAHSSQHRWGRGQPIIDYIDTPEGRIYTATYPDGTENSDLWPSRESKPGEDIETFLNRAEEPIQFNLAEESLYYGTSTIFQEEIAKNGIKAPSEWGSYGLAEENAMKIVEKHGGEPAVIQIPLSEFKDEHFLLDESNNDVIIYTEDLHIFMEKQEKKLV